MDVTDHDQEYAAHLTNSGRLLDLVFPGGRCLCIPRRGPKTSLRLVAVPVSERWAVLVDPGEQSRGFCNAVDGNAIPWLAGWSITGREVRCGESRIDLEISGDGQIGYIETKSAAMLIGDRVGSFPDCPTTRGRKHIGTMRRLARGHRSIIAFLVQHPEASAFSPNSHGDPLFAAYLADAQRDGVEIRAVKMCMDISGDVFVADPDLYCYF